MKVYDPNDDYDEEYLEYGLFMSRREYKVITRRLHSGIISAIKEGKFVSGRVPYGYKKIKLERQKGYSLIPEEETYRNVQLIFNMYANGNGVNAISRKLADLNIPTRNSKTWSTSSIATVLTNPVFSSPKASVIESTLSVKSAVASFKYSKPATLSVTA